MRKDIYTPAAVAEAIVRRGREDMNPQACTKIMIGDYEISIAMDTSITGFQHNMDRTDIRIYDRGADCKREGGDDITQQFAKEMGCEIEEGGSHLFTDADDLFDIMVHARNLMSRKRSREELKGVTTLGDDVLKLHK